MEEILKTMIQALVENSEEVAIEKKEDEKFIIFEVKVSKEDMGKVIGRQGRMAKSIRTIMKAIASRENKKVQVEFIG